MSEPSDRSRSFKARKSRLSRGAVFSGARARAGITNDSHRLTNLIRLLPIPAAEIRENTRTTAKKIMSRLRSALRQERKRGRAGHWTYDLNRHIALYQALNTEIQRIRQK